MVEESRRATVLLGGGIDSAALVPLLQDQGFTVQGVHYDYGQPACREERAAVRKLAQHYGILAAELHLGRPLPASDGVFENRNAQLVLAATGLVKPPGVLALGIHAGTPFFDCSPNFFEALQKMVVGYTKGQVRVLAPWLNATKADVVAYARDRGVPFSLTYSCQSGGPIVCGSCLSCRDREVLACI